MGPPDTGAPVHLIHVVGGRDDAIAYDELLAHATRLPQLRFTLIEGVRRLPG